MTKTITKLVFNGQTYYIREIPAENRVLFTETDLENNDLGLFTAETTSWDGQYPRVLASINNDGSGNYYFETSGGQPLCLRLRENYPLLRQVPAGKTTRKVKLVMDYLSATDFNIEVTMGRFNRDSLYQNCMSIDSSRTNSRGVYEANVVYTAETILDVTDNTEQGTIYKKSDGSVRTTFGPYTLSTAQSGTYYENDCWAGYGTDRDPTNIKFGNVHLYTRDY